MSTKIKSWMENSQNGSRKAAELLLCLGKEEASNVLQHMSLDEVRSVVCELFRMKGQQELEQEFFSQSDSKNDKDHSVGGGIDIARGFLRVAFGTCEGDRILRNAASDFLDRPFAFLEHLDDFHLVSFLKGESLQTLALILLNLSPQKAKLILRTMSLDVQIDLVKRIAIMKKVDNSVILRVEEILKERIKEYDAAFKITGVDGQQTLANILRHMSLNNEKKILTYLAEKKSSVAKGVEAHLLTIENLLDITDRNLYEVLCRMDEQEIAVLIRGKSQQVRTKILNAVSSIKREEILNSEITISSIKKKEVDKVTRKFLEEIRRRELQGDFTVLRAGETFV